MSKVLVDTSIWIDVFRGNDVAKLLITLIDDGRIVTTVLTMQVFRPRYSAM